MNTYRMSSTPISLHVILIGPRLGLVDFQSKILQSEVIDRGFHSGVSLASADIPGKPEFMIMNDAFIRKERRGESYPRQTAEPAG